MSDLRMLGNYLRVHRRRAGLTQRELGQLVGYNRPWQVSRHERSKTVPPLLIAIAYQEIFKVPLTEIFTGIHATVAHVVEQNTNGFEHRLRDGRGGKHGASGTAQKLKWITQRKKLE